jgi:hypothetical protein
MALDVMVSPDLRPQNSYASSSIALSSLSVTKMHTQCVSAFYSVPLILAANAILIELDLLQLVSRIQFEGVLF